MPDQNPSLPGRALQKTCTLVVFLCAVHLSVTLLYYLNTLDVFRNSFAQNQQQNTYSTSALSRSEATLTSNLSERQPPGARSPTVKAKDLEQCPETSPLLVGPLRIEFSQPVGLKQIELENPELRDGGRYMPKDCVARQKVAFIIPFRKREEHLKFWLYYLHPILQRQQLDYGVYVINQIFLEHSICRGLGWYDKNLVCSHARCLSEELRRPRCHLGPVL
nr:PREDICTED: beta-1,4-galactosyltransferase 1 isoform X2 [Lepisosteus oculatus]